MFLINWPRVLYSSVPLLLGAEAVPPEVPSEVLMLPSGCGWLLSVASSNQTGGAVPEADLMLKLIPLYALTS